MNRRKDKKRRLERWDWEKLLEVDKGKRKFSRVNTFIRVFVVILITQKENIKR